MEAGSLINRISLITGALVALLCLCTAAPAPAAGRAGAVARSCGDIPSMYTWDVEAKRVGCGRAKAIARTYDRRVAADLEHKWNLTVEGFRCVIVKIVYYGDTHRCSAGGGRAVTFWRGKPRSRSRRDRRNANPS